jgi:hypothetical protein
MSTKNNIHNDKLLKSPNNVVSVCQYYTSLQPSLESKCVKTSEESTMALIGQ